MPDRDEKGRLLPGNQLAKGKGRPRREVEEKYLKTLSAAVSLKDWRAIVERAVQQALDGDDKARAFLANYLIGRPTEYLNADVTSNNERMGGDLTDEQRLAAIGAAFSAIGSGLSASVDGRAASVDPAGGAAG